MLKRLVLKTIILLFAGLPTLQTSEKLIFAVDLIRHGDRTPLKELPNAHYEWQEGLGNLTKLGAKQEFQLGLRQRDKYIHHYQLLPPCYHPMLMYVRSTSYTRTQASAQSFLAGFYPPSTRPFTHKKIPIYTTPKKNDQLLICKPTNIFTLLHLYFLDRLTWDKKTNPEEIAQWSQQTGLPLNSFRQLGVLADNLYIRCLHGVPLPNGMTQQSVNKILMLTQWAMVQCFSLNDVTYRMGHEFITTIDNYFNLAVNKRTPLKYALFAAHDTSIMSVMTTLGVPLTRVPPYASDLSFLLFENNNHYYIKLNYNNKLVFIPGCRGTVCSLEQFHSLAKNGFIH